MRKGIYVLLVFQLCFILNLCGQQKGVIALQTSEKQLSSRNTFAVVVGISDYQDPAIPDLKYADKDAEAFANYLRSEAGGMLDGDHLKVLLNEHATMGQMANALDWLLEVSKENDRVYIYFSGHGDVEKKTLSQPGYLLCWDSPARVYLGGGAMALPMFQDVISTLSIQNKAKVIVISDACHAGKLSGSNINGTQATAANLAKQFANEIKILSCQPNEYSIEGQQWGGGRGAFSYHLIEGLYGLADLNGDKSVSLLEVSRYLEDNVSKEVAPLSQMPMVAGDKSEKLSKVVSELVATNRRNNTNEVPLFAATESRGLEEEILSTTDSFTRTSFYHFNQSLKNKNFFEPEKDCAEYYYAILSNDERLSRLHSTMRRNYAAVLQDDAQQVINKYMKAELHEISISISERVKKYELYPKLLAKAAELLGDQHYLYKDLQARKNYFLAFRYTYGVDYNLITYNKGLNHMREALQWQPDMPLALLGMVYIFGYQLLNKDSAEYYANKANESAPNWILPFTKVAKTLSTSFLDFEKSMKYLEKAKKIDAENPLVWEAEANYYFDIGDFNEAKIVLEKIVEKQPSSVCLPCSKNLLVQTYIEIGDYSTAETMALKLFIADTNQFNTRINLGKIYTLMHRLELAKIEFRAVARISSVNSNPESTYQYWLSYLYAHEGNFDEAFKSFEQSIKFGYDDYSWMQIDPEYKLLRNQKEKWDELMKKYFPDKMK